MVTVCPECGKPPLEVHTEHGTVKVDACFGALLGEVISACCGHGGRKPAYIRIHTGTGSHVDVCNGTVGDYCDVFACVVDESAGHAEEGKS